MDINPEPHKINNSKHYNVLLKEYNNRYSFNKSIRGNVIIMSIEDQKHLILPIELDSILKILIS